LPAKQTGAKKRRYNTTVYTVPLQILQSYKRHAAD